MDKNIEEKFIKNFVSKKMQERLIFELSNLKNRRKGISRFANADEILNRAFVYIKDKNLTLSDVEKEISKYINKNADCYNISENELDGKTASFQKSLQASFDSFMVSIIVCGDKVAFIKTETEFGPPEKYILMIK